MHSGSDTVLIIGARSSLALAISDALGSANIRTVLADLPHINEKSELLEIDITDIESCRLVANDQRLGQLVGVVCCAGRGGRAGILHGTLNDWEAVIRVNLTGARNVLNAFAPKLLRDEQKNAFVFISSVNGTLPVKGYSAYCASKAGLEMLIKVAALELAPHLRVNCVAPGPLYTNNPVHEAFPAFLASLEKRHPLGGRLTYNKEVAEAVVFLLSENATRISGQTITVDGAVSLNYGNLPDPEEEQYEA